MIYLKTGIGIELRGEDMLFASLQSNFSGGTFTHFHRIADYRLREKEDLKREVHHFFRSHGLSKDAVVLGIPRKDIVLRQLDLPMEVKDNLRQVIQYQVQSFEPTEDDKYYYDFVVLNDAAEQKRLAVLLMMVRQSLLDEHLRLLRALEIRPVAVLGSSMGLANLYLHQQRDVENKTFLLADLSQSNMELLALRHGKLRYSQDTPKTAEAAWGDLLLREANEAVSKLRLNPEGTVEKIVVAGESSETALEEIRRRIPDCEPLKKSFAFSVPVANQAHIQEAASTLGLAFSGIARHPAIRANLLPAAMKSRQSRWAHITAALLGAVILLLLVALAIRPTIQNRMLLAELDREIQSLNAAVQKVRSLRSQGDAQEERLRLVEQLVRHKDRNLEILQELTHILPDNTSLRSYSNRDGVIQMVGLSGSSSDLIPKLEKSPLLKDVVQKGVIYKDSQTGKDRFTFEAKLEK